MQTTVRQVNAQRHSKAPVRVWGGVVPPDIIQIALSESDLQQYAETQGITKEAAFAWVKKISPRSAAQYKFSKHYCSGSKPAFKREFYPLFISIQAAALKAQGVAWNHEQLAKDMLDLHDPACVTAVHAFKHQLDLELQQPHNQTLQDVYLDCVACYAKWFQEALTKYLELGVHGSVAHCTCTDTRSFSIRAHSHTPV